jgi:hypothetical protein
MNIEFDNVTIKIWFENASRNIENVVAIVQQNNWWIVYHSNDKQTLVNATKCNLIEVI